MGVEIKCLIVNNMIVGGIAVLCVIFVALMILFE